MAILEFRRRIGCTQQQLGESTGVSASMVAQWESGKKDPSYDSLKRMFQLGATVEELFGVPCNCAKAEAKTDAPVEMSQLEAFREVFKRLEALEKERAKWAGYEPDKRSRGAG